MLYPQFQLERMIQLNKKKTAAFLSALCMTVSALPNPAIFYQSAFAADAAPEEKNFDILKYTAVDGQVKVTGTTEKLPEVYAIPSVIDGMPVTALGEKAFQKQVSLVSLTLPEGLTSFGASACYDCDKLKSITFPSSVTEIGESAFASCNSLAEINLNEGLKTIKNSAFFGAVESALTLPSTLETIGQDAFTSNSNLTEVTVPDSVTTLENAAFKY